MITIDAVLTLPCVLGGAGEANDSRHEDQRQVMKSIGKIRNAEQCVGF